MKIIQELAKEIGEIECKLCADKKRYKIPNGIKIHMAKSHPTENHVDPCADDFEKLLSKYKNETKVVKRIPRGARTVVAQKLTSTIDECVEKNTVAAWKVLFFFFISFLKYI